MTKYVISDICPESVIMYNDGSTIIDYSGSVDLQEAIDRHSRSKSILGHQLEEAYQYFRAYSHEELLKFAHSSLDWPVIFGFVVEDRNYK